MSDEQWRRVSWAPGYEVSDRGRVRGFLSKGPNTYLREMPRILRQSGRRYLKVGLCFDGHRTFALVHRLVLQAFVGPCPDGMEARHVNVNDKKNNALDNLAWGTKEENENDKIAHGTKLCGELVGTAKINAADAVEIKRLVDSGSELTEVACRFGISDTHARRIADREAWAHATAEQPTP